MSMQPRRNRLFDIEVDEVSAVDRPASAQGLIAIAKSLGPEEAGMADDEQMTFDIPADVQHGDTVVAEDGSEYVYLETDDDGAALPLDGVDVDELVSSADQVFDLSGLEDDAEDYADPASVGKAVVKPANFRAAFGVGRKEGMGGAKQIVRRPGSSNKANPASVVPPSLGVMAGRATGHAAGATERVAREGAARGTEYVKKNPLKAAAIAGGAGVAGGGAYMVAQKSLGTTVLEELSKAVSAEERDQIVAKMADELEGLGAENEELRKAFEEERDIRVTEAFIAKAAEYELPVDPEVFGPILKAIVEVLDDDELEVLDTVLSSRGVALDEIGYTGGASNSGVLDEVSGLAAELVGKAAGNVTPEQAVTALFDNNPSAYDAYLAEQSGR